MKARVKWLDHMSFVGESGSGHSVVMDGAPEVGGRNMGVRPMEMVLLGVDNAGPGGRRAKKRPRLGEVRVAESAGEREWTLFTSCGDQIPSL